MGRTASLIILLLLSFGCRGPGEYPDGPILLVCPWAVGGGTDRVSRQVAVFLEEELDVPVNVINATGGAGVTGHSRGAHARPDGYTLTMMTVELNMLHWRGLTHISWHDFTPVMLINQDPAALLVRVRDSRWENLQELARAAREQPGKLTASGTASGGIWHLALAGWLNSLGLPAHTIRWIPMNGAGPSLQELASGGIDLVCCSLPEARTLMAAGQVRALGVMSESRSPGHPQVPTFAEQGSAWSMGGWRGLGLPRDAPEDVVQRLVGAMGRIVSGQTMVAGKTFPEFMALENFNFSWQQPQAFRQTLERFEAELGRLLRSPEFAGLDEGRFQVHDFPGLLMVLLGANLLVLSVSVFKRAREEKRGTHVTREGIIHVLCIGCAVALFVAFVETLGFVLTAALILFALMWKLGTRVWVGLVVSVLLVFLVYVLFVDLLRVPLPRGLLGW